MWGGVQFLIPLLNCKQIKDETQPTDRYSHGQYIYANICMV